MRKTGLILAFLAVSCTVRAQNLTPAQKDADFRYLASLFSTYYAPLDWKKQLFGFDALSIGPWLDRVAQTTTDLDFYELCVEYVASLNDTHDHYSLTSDFSVTLGFTADVYDGVLLIDSINRTLLPSSKYPLVIGDQLISVDGIPVEQYLTDYVKYVAYGNPIAARRQAAVRITTRPQSRMPHAVDFLGKSAEVVIKQQSGNTVTYTMPWIASGTPMEVGPTLSPHVTTARKRALESKPSDEPDYMTALREAQWSGILDADDVGLNGYGSRNPVFASALANYHFTLRFGANSADFYYSGTLKYEDLTIGYIRIPNYSPPNVNTALTQFEQELAYMSANTDGLIVDEMRNTGGNLCYGEEIAARLIPYQFRATGFQVRPFWSRINSFYNSMISAIANKSSQQIIDQYTMLYQAMLTANQQGALVTDSLPLCTSSLIRDPLLDKDGKLIAFQKPLVMLIDEFSTSTADSVPGMMQDAGRAVLVGMRSDGAGGNNTTITAGSFSEGTTGMTLALQTRKAPVSVSGYPDSIYIENVGVWPDITLDYMTKDNLLQSGAPFVASVLESTAAQIRQQH
jgi:hypothetical protein